MYFLEANCVLYEIKHQPSFPEPRHAIIVPKVHKILHVLCLNRAQAYSRKLDSLKGKA